MLKKLLILLFLFSFPNALLAKNVSEFYENEDYDAAYRSGYAEALSGDPESSFILGKILIDGKGSANKNVNKGIQFIISAAESDYLKAVVFLAEDYEEGNYSSPNKSRALKYYEQAENLGYKKARKKVTELRIALSGAISKKSCVRYNKNDKKNFYNIGQCIVRNYLEGNASSYFLKAFDNGNKGAYLLASNRMLKEKDINLMPLVKRIPEFKRKASRSQKDKFVNQIKKYGYDGSFCGEPKKKSSKKNMFAKSKPSTGVNFAACALAAEAGDPVAMPLAYEWWNNGSQGFPKAKKYAQQLIENLESNEDADIASILRKFEDDPKKHFKKSMEYIKSTPLSQKIVGKELKLEIGLIANGDALSFASSYRDIADVIEYVDWNSVQPKVLAKFYHFYKLDLLDQEHDGELDTPRVMKNLKKIPFKETFVSELGSFENGGELAYNYLTSVIFDNCDALDYASKNIDKLDIPIDLIQDAQSNLINKCNLNFEQRSIKELLRIAKRELETVKIIIENRLNKKRLPCNDYNDFLKYNRNDLSDFEIDYDRNNEICATFPAVAYNLSTNAYSKKAFDEAYEYARKGCVNEDHPSRGCDLLAMIIIEGKSSKVSDMTYDQKMQEAIGYLTTGHEKDDINSTAFLYGIVNKPVLFSRYANTQMAKDLLTVLEKSDELSATIQIKNNCFSADPIKRLLTNCKPVCAWAKRKNQSKEIDIVSRYSLQSILKKPDCNPQQN